MSLLAPTLQAFFTERLIGQRQASPHTVAAYRDSFRLLLGYLANSTGKSPAELDFDDLDAKTIGGFLTHLERDRGASAATRNARLAAVRSLFSFAAFRHPEHAALIARVLAIPAKRRGRPLVTFLTRPEVDALLGAPDRRRWTGRRDHALLTLTVQTGLRVSELTRLCHLDVAVGRGAHVRVHGKGRKERVTPLTSHTVAVLRAWLDERDAAPDDPVFPAPPGRPLGRDAIRKLVVKHARTAAVGCPSLATKQVGVHTLRHSCAMNLLQSGVDLATIALWLGHEDLRTVQIYLHADLAHKERALARTTPPNTRPGRYRRPDPCLPRGPVIMRNRSGRRASEAHQCRATRHPSRPAPHNPGFRLMGVAQRMGGLVVAPVRRPPVVDGHPPEPRQDPGVVHRRSAPLGMHAEPAQPRIRRRMDPVQPARHPRAALVEVRDLSPGQLRADLLGEPAQPAAPSAVIAASVPVATLAPSTSPSSSAARSTGRYWPTVR